VNSDTKRWLAAIRWLRAPGPLQPPGYSRGMDGVRRPTGDVARLAEVMAALSLATDLGMSLPLETGLRICLVATEVGRRLDLEDGELRRTYYLALLRHIGCTAASHDFANLIGDEDGFHRRANYVDISSPKVAMPLMLRYIGHDEPLPGRLRALARFVRHMSEVKESSAAVCEVAQHLAARLGFDDALQEDLVMVYERYDGKGFPRGIPGEQVSRPAQLVLLAETAVNQTELAGLEAATAVVSERRGHALHPAVADVFLAAPKELMAPTESDDVWSSTLDVEPGMSTALTGDPLDEALRTVADFTDLKSPYTVGHSTAVADLAERAAQQCGAPPRDQQLVRRAGFLHDLGRVSVSAQVWSKPAPLNRDEREKVRLHPYYTDRVLDRPGFFGSIGAIAAAHHERVDGSGYHRAVRGDTLTAAAKLLAAADIYAALTETRPHRPAYDDKDAARILRAEVTEGRLDGTAADAVLAAAGHPVRRRRTGVAGLTPRELDVLQLVARGASTKQVAEQLVIARKTAEHHIESIYAKAGVTTRAAATHFALQHGLVGPE
jgi:HD-GYP domain-containing protein (c-di-GMP phosphodiesterase class II)